MKHIFIDVHGVLNPFRYHPGFDVHYAEVEGFIYKLFLNPEHGEWLKTLAKDTDSALVWGTTWQQYANDQIGSRIGLPELPYLDLDKCPDRKLSDSLGTVKAKAAKLYAGKSRFVYFDDEPDIGTALKGTEGMHFVVEPNTGLTEKTISAARNYLLS